MSFFTIVGMIVTGIVALGILFVIALIVKDFLGYQKGARNYRHLLAIGEDKSQWFWTKHGVKMWLKSFREGGGWYVETSDPEDDNFDLRIYQNGSIVRMPTRYR